MLILLIKDRHLPIIIHLIKLSIKLHFILSYEHGKHYLIQHLLNFLIRFTILCSLAIALFNIYRKGVSFILVGVTVFDLVKFFVDVCITGAKSALINFTINR